jgi:hypothetical protein
MPWTPCAKRKGQERTKDKKTEVPGTQKEDEGKEKGRQLELYQTIPL